ncbi:MAG: hypothetical protein DI629_13590 [Mesorhizobium amorphae]|nr:MAG: hypothetical protein DI629_13590 [Mesorhizobium amorphae]
MHIRETEASRTSRGVTAWTPWGPQKVSLAERRQERSGKNKGERRAGASDPHRSPSDRAS